MRKLATITCGLGIMIPSVQRFTQEDSYAIAFGTAWQEHLYGYAANNPVRYIDPTGHYVSSWDKKHLSSKEIKSLEQATKRWNNGNAAEKKKAHADAERIRNNYRSSDEMSTGDGNTVKKRSSSTKTTPATKSVLELSAPA